MKKKAIIIFGTFITLLLIFAFTCDGIVRHAAYKKCYNNVDPIPVSELGILLGTGRSALPSPYYDARIQAAVDLIKKDKINTLFISGENLYADYHEVDSIAKTMNQLFPNLSIIVDTLGTDTYTSLKNARAYGTLDDTYIIISQHFHNQRALYYAKYIFDGGHVVAYDAEDTDKLIWRIRNVIREFGARIKAIAFILSKD